MGTGVTGLWTGLDIPMERKLGPLVWVPLLVLLGACDDDDGSAAAGLQPVPEAPPLPRPLLTLPRFDCAPLPDTAGDCRRDADCGQSDVCSLGRPTSDGEPARLTCQPPTALDEGVEPPEAVDGACRQASDCDNGLCSLTGACVRACETAEDCAVGYFCSPVHVRSDRGLHPVGGCVRSHAFSADVRVSVADPVVVSARFGTNLSTPPLTGTALAFQSPECGRLVEVLQVTDRAGAGTLYDVDDLFAGRVTPNPVATFGSFVAALLPNNPVLDVGSQGYNLTLISDEDTEVRTAYARREGVSEILDLNLFLVGGGDFGPDDPELASVLDRVDERFAAHGFRLGTRRYVEVSGALRERFEVLDVEVVVDDDGTLQDVRIEDLEPMFRLSAGLEYGGVNLFFVRGMGDVLGVSGGIPGSLGLHGTAYSGVALAVDVVGLPALDSVIAHELSHQLGLFHTSELDGFVVEPLQDTPSCGPERDTDENGVLSPAECQGYGSDNLMFWAGTGAELSPQQVQVLRSSPVLR